LTPKIQTVSVYGKKGGSVPSTAGLESVKGDGRGSKTPPARAKQASRTPKRVRGKERRQQYSILGLEGVAENKGKEAKGGTVAAYCLIRGDHGKVVSEFRLQGKRKRQRDLAVGGADFAEVDALRPVATRGKP